MKFSTKSLAFTFYIAVIALVGWFTPSPATHKLKEQVITGFMSQTQLTAQLPLSSQSICRLVDTYSGRRSPIRA